MWLVLLTAIAADPWPRRACDVPGPDLATLPAQSADACEAACSERADCGAYTFVTGLNRCSLERAGSRAFDVRLFAARLQAEGGARTTSEPAADHDHAGKDLERTPRDLPSTEACASACVQTASCVGFVYIQGYRACWLKATDGELTPKRFACAARPASTDPTAVPRDASTPTP